MDALKEEAFIVRHAVPADVPALNEAIARIDGETEFLGLPGEYLRRWAPGFAERLAVMNEKGTGAYVIAAAGGEIVGFLGAFAGANARTRGVVYIAHVGVRAAWRGRGIGAALFAAIEDWARAQNAKRRRGSSRSTSTWAARPRAGRWRRTTCSTPFGPGSSCPR